MDRQCTPSGGGEGWREGEEEGEMDGEGEGGSEGGREIRRGVGWREEGGGKEKGSCRAQIINQEVLIMNIRCLGLS